MRAVFHRSNFYNAMHTIYGELGAFGTAFVFELADVRGGFRFLPLCAGEYVLDCDAARRVDTVFRRTAMTLRQLLQAFGPAALPESLRRQAAVQPDARHNVIQAVYPRTERNPALLTARHMPVASVYWLEGREGQGHPLRQSGFRSFPGFGPRWDVAGNDVYGRSPAMDALPTARMLQQMGVTTLKAIHKAVDPPMSVAAGLRSVGLDLTPGGINYVDSAPGQSPQAATPLLQVNPDLATARKAMEAVQNQIRNGLYNDLFKLILEGRSRGHGQRDRRPRGGKTGAHRARAGTPARRAVHPAHGPHLPVHGRAGHAAALPAGAHGRRLKVEFVSLAGPGAKTGGRERHRPISGLDP